MSRILLIEDEPGLVLTLTDRLGSEGYVLETAGDGESGLESALRGDFDLIILDVMLPKKNGFDVCRDLRRRDVTTPILMLTARGQVADKVVGLKLGADDYLTKPFDMMELQARIEALLRRVSTGVSSIAPMPDAARPNDQGPAANGAVSRAGASGYRAAGNYPAVYHFGSITVDFRRAEILRDGQPVALSAREFQLLRYFIEHRGATLSRDELLNGVWGYDAMPATRTVDVHVAWLRQKLEPTPGHPQFILTVHRLGYKFVG